MFIATVFLTIIGMAAGFVLGERHRRRVSGQGRPPADSQTVFPAPTAEGPGPYCPDETLTIASELGFPSDLRQVLRIVTDNGTVVWICQDPAGALYYQGKTGGQDAPLIQGENGLFLSEVVRQSADEYEATAANGNQFVVTRERLEVHFASGEPTRINKVVSVG